MKTIYDYLHSGGKFDHIKTDEMLGDVQKIAAKTTELDKNQKAVLYRFGTLIFNYLDKECNPDDFNFTSFFKLLYCEMLDENHETEYSTVLDVLLDDAKGNETIYMLTQYWYSLQKHMPENADEIYRVAFKRYCYVNEIEWDDDVISKVKELREQGEKEEEESKRDYDEMFECIERINNFLAAFEDYNRNRTVQDYDEAREILESFPRITGMDDLIYIHFDTVLEKLRVHGPVFKMIDARYILKI